MRKITVALLFCVLIMLAGCSNKDKASLVDMMHNLDAEQTKVFFWSEGEMQEIELTAEETGKLLSILSNLTEACITENKHLAGITPEFGFHFIVNNNDYYINQAGAPHGETEIGYQEKQWWIENEVLYEYMQSF